MNLSCTHLLLITMPQMFGSCVYVENAFTNIIKADDQKRVSLPLSYKKSRLENLLSDLILTFVLYRLPNSYAYQDTEVDV